MEQSAAALYETAKDYEAKGDLAKAIEYYKKAERMGHDLRDDWEHEGYIPPIEPLKALEIRTTPSFTLVLVDLQLDLVKKLEEHFRDLPNVEIHHGRFEDQEKFDCMVSAANSFGLMDGGVDAAITRFFGEQLQSRVQRYILDHFQGEQPVGTSFIIHSGKDEHPWIAHTPTMRVPMPINGTDYVYLAMKAMLRAVHRHNAKEAKKLQGEAGEQVSRQIKRVVCTGLGTFYGKMALDEAARQMALAYRNFLSPPDAISWVFAGSRQNQIGYGGWNGFEREVAKEKTKPKS